MLGIQETNNRGKCFRYQEETLEDVNHLQHNVNFIRKMFLVNSGTDVEPGTAGCKRVEC